MAGRRSPLRPRGSSGRSHEQDDEDEWQTFYDAARTMGYTCASVQRTVRGRFARVICRGERG